MDWRRQHDQTDVGQVLAGLPSSSTIHPLGSAHLVLGPTGAQVVVLDDGSTDLPRTAARLAAVVRSALAERVSWVPYVHTLLVTESTAPRPPATVVSAHLLVRALVEGPTTLDQADLGRLVASIEGGSLAGLDSLAPTGLPLGSAH